MSPALRWHPEETRGCTPGCRAGLVQTDLADELIIRIKDKLGEEATMKMAVRATMQLMIASLP